MPLTQDRDTPSRDGKTLSIPMAANAVIFAGALVVTNAAGNAAPGSVAPTLKGAGRASQFADNTGGSIGDKRAEVEVGTFRFKNSSAGDAITLADRGNDCYVVDDETVAKTNGTNTRSVAGKIFDVDAQGVWVKFS